MIMDNSEQKKVTIYSYSKVWKVEKRIYAIQNLVLPGPHRPMATAYILVSHGPAINLIFGCTAGI